MNEYVLDKTKLQVLSKRMNEALHCDKCLAVLKPGDQVVSKHSAHSHRKLYHKSCYESLYI